MQKITFYLFAFCSTLLLSQESRMANDLQSKSFEELIELYDLNVKDTLFAKDIALKYIEKAIHDDDSLKIARGYSRMAFIAAHNDAIRFLDSTILYSKNANHPNFPTIGYLFKSLYQYNQEDYESSLRNAIEGYQYAKKKENSEHQIMALHQINGINELWGDYSKTLEAEKLTLQLLQNNPNINRYYEHYVASLEGLGKCYVRLQKPDSAIYFFNKGIKASLNNNDTITYLAFVSRMGSALYLDGSYKKALDSLEKANQASAYFVDSYPIYYHYYKGLNLERLGEELFAIENFKAIDSIYQRDKTLTPELPDTYNKLVSYYKDQDNKDMQLDYLQKLVAIDSLIDVKQIYVKDKTTEDYTIPSLLEDKNDFIKGLQDKNQRANIKLWLLIISLLAVIVVGFYYYRRQQLFKKRYNLLMEKERIPSISRKTSPSPKKSTDISQEITQELLAKLDVFEKNKEYLSTAISLNKMAKSLGTNSTYLSKVINNEKEKNFSNYINHLRIEYAFEELKSNPTFRKYTIKAIAEECGFKNAESFSKTFYRVYGFYPSFYVRKLKEDQ